MYFGQVYHGILWVSWCTILNTMVHDNDNHLLPWHGSLNNGRDTICFYIRGWSGGGIHRTIACELHERVQTMVDDNNQVFMNNLVFHNVQLYLTLFRFQMGRTLSSLISAHTHTQPPPLPPRAWQCLDGCKNTHSGWEKYFQADI